jgi:hypothetical protein
MGTAGLVVATGNITGGNLVTGGALAVTGNANVGNLGTVKIEATGNVTTTGNSFARCFIPTSTFTPVNGLFLSAANAVGLSANSVERVTVDSTGKVGINQTSPSYRLDVNGDVRFVNALTLSGSTANGVAYLNTSKIVTAGAVFTYDGTNLSVGTGAITLGSLTTGANTTAGSITGNWTLTSGSQLNATYADLAEYYTADAVYESGTVLEFGGAHEVTLASDSTNRVAGVVSTNPAYVMNSTCEGEFIIQLALQGRVPCKVRGSIRKGDMLVSGGDGFARPSASPLIGTVIGKSLENFDGVTGIIEVAVGRL